MSKKPKIIDLHSHWFSPQAKEFLLKKTSGTRFVQGDDGLYLNRAVNDGLPPQFKLQPQWFDIEKRIEHLEENNVVHQLISWPTTLEIDSTITPDESRVLSDAFNEDLANLVRQYPQIFSGLAYVTTSDGEYAVKQLQKAHEAQGLIGAVLPVGALSTYEAATNLKALFKQADKLSSHIYLHTGFAHDAIDGQLRPFKPAKIYPQKHALDTAYVFASAVFTLLFTDFLDEFPNVTVQIAMLGGSGIFALVFEQFKDNPERFKLDDKVYTRLSQITFDTGAAGGGINAVTAVANILGADKVVFGSDYAPQPSVRKVIDNVSKTNLDDSAKQKIFFDNGAKLLAAKNVAIGSHSEVSYTNSNTNKESLNV